MVKTPAFDRVAGSGVLLTHAFVDAPSCTPSRSAILTGQHMWRLAAAGNLHSTLRAKFQVYPEILEKAGYVVGYSGRMVARSSGARGQGPQSAGPRFRDFQTFLAQMPSGSSFCYWLGSHYPHRPYPPGSGLRAGKRPHYGNSQILPGRLRNPADWASLAHSWLLRIPSCAPPWISRRPFQLSLSTRETTWTRGSNFTREPEGGKWEVDSGRLPEGFKRSLP